MRVTKNSRFRPRASKRKNEISEKPSSSAASEPQPKRASRRNENEHKEDSNLIAKGSSTPSSPLYADIYCWSCHIEADDRVSRLCTLCRRVYHQACLDKMNLSFNYSGACPECQFKSVDGTELKSSRFFCFDKLKRMLDVLTRRCFAKKRERNEFFLRWPVEDKGKLYRIMDFEILLDKINHVPPYTNTAEIYGDVKYIFHNAWIVYEANSDQAKAAESIKRDFKTELVSLEACPECYYYLFCDESDKDPFIRLCETPHDIVWAQVSRHSYWPAKVLKVVNGFALVRFFGEHEQSKVPINKCYFLSASHPKDKNSNLNIPLNSGLKSHAFQCARTELLKYIRLYEKRYGAGAFQFYPHKTLYQPQERQNEVILSSAEGSSTRNTVEMKLEANGDEKDLEANVISEKAIMGDLEDRSGFENNPSNNAASKDGIWNNNPSAVTSIHMVFSSENPSTTEDEPTNPVVTSFESLQPTESPDVSLAIENFGNLQLEGLKETIHSTEISNVTIATNASDDSNSLCSVMNNFPSSAGNQIDDEIVYIGQRTAEEDEPFNPNIVLQQLMEISPELKQVSDSVKYAMDGLLIQLLAGIHRKPSNLATRISKLSGIQRKLEKKLKCFEDESDKLRKENESLKSQLELKESELRKLNSENESLSLDITKQKDQNIKIINNAKGIINGFVNKTEMQNLKELLKNEMEKNRLLTRELEEAKLAKECANNKLAPVPADKIKEFKITNYCYVCQLPAAFVCCLNASYCSTKCQKKHAEEHRPHCKKEISSQTIVKQTVSESILYVCGEGIITSEESSMNNQCNLEIPNTDSVSGSTRIQKVQTHPASLSRPLLPTSHDSAAASSSHSHASNSKRRSHT